MGDDPSGVVDLARMRQHYDDDRSAILAGTGPAEAVNRAVARIVRDVQMEVRVGRFVLHTDEPEERGGWGTAPAPLQLFVAGIGTCLLTQVARFAPLYDVPVLAAEADVRMSIDRREKLDIEGPGAAARWIRVALRIDSPAPPERVRLLVAHVERACHAESSLREPVPVETTATLNGEPLG